MVPEFVEFHKIARLSRPCVVTEKIDGTNGVIYIGEDGLFVAGSRTQWLTDEKPDNHGFRAWCYANKDALMTLGPGTHYGEWWGSGIQRGYGLSKGEKRFSLFNVKRWALYGTEPQLIPSNNPKAEPKYQGVLPACVGLVPVLWRGPFDPVEIERVLGELAAKGSVAAPGFMRPEGVVIFHVAQGHLFKKTIEKDDEPKSLRPDAARPQVHTHAQA